jgi:RNA polymerase sigma-70 factor (ECF subfamily)
MALKDLFGFTLAETADVLRTTPGAVKAALHPGERAAGGSRSQYRAQGAR